MLIISDNYIDCAALLLASESECIDPNYTDRLAKFARGEFDEYFPMGSITAHRAVVTVSEKILIPTSPISTSPTSSVSETPAPVLSVVEAAHSNSEPLRAVSSTRAPTNTQEAREARLKRNRLSAKFSREKQNKYLASLKEQEKDLTARNKELRAQIKQLTAEISLLKGKTKVAKL